MKEAVTIDRYGRKVPKHAHGTANLKRQTSSTKLITEAVMELYDRIVDKNLLVRRINITANKLVDEETASKNNAYEQLDLFTDYKAKEEENAMEREKRMQKAMLNIKKKFGKNAILKGMNLEEERQPKTVMSRLAGIRHSRMLNLGDEDMKYKVKITILKFEMDKELEA